jgi:glucan phosphorylase
LHALGFDIRTYHLNEGHAAFLTLELLNRSRVAPEDLAPGEEPYDIPEVRSRCVFTTHTPVEAGHDEMQLAARLVAGVDLWLNTPLPPREASGTSGMKAALNGVVNCSVLDGWWIEACVEGVTGWSIGDGASVEDDAAAADLCRKLERTILPLYYTDAAGWRAMMKQSIGNIASYFNTHRMMRRYATEAYLR